MAKIIHYIEPRNSGKTTLAKRLCEEGGFYWLIDSRSLKHNSEAVCRFAFDSTNKERQYDNVIIDEYISQYLKENKAGRARIIDFIGRKILPSMKKDGKIILISTPEVRYTREQLMLASVGHFQDAFMPHSPYFTEKVKETRDEIKGSFLTSGNVEFRQNTLITRIDNEQGYREAVGEEYYQLSYKANFIKD